MDDRAEGPPLRYAKGLDPRTQTIKVGGIHVSREQWEDMDRYARNRLYQQQGLLPGPDLLQNIRSLGELIQRLDDTPPSTVIMWQEKQFTYVAIKAAGQWYTTATDENPYVNQVASSPELSRYLQRAHLVTELKPT